MTDFASVLEETRLLHRKSDLLNLANAQLSLEEFRREINSHIDGLVTEIAALAENEWPPEGTVWEIYQRCEKFTRKNSNW